jgi:hypothetical protein
MKFYLYIYQQQSCTKLHMEGVFTQEELDRYSLNFLCGLYKTTVGNLNQTARGVDILFKSVTPGAYERPTLAFEATNEIVMELVRRGLIEAHSIEQIKLTSKGLGKCRQDCK